VCEGVRENPLRGEMVGKEEDKLELIRDSACVSLQIRRRSRTVPAAREKRLDGRRIAGEENCLCFTSSTERVWCGTECALK